MAKNIGTIGVGLSYRLVNFFARAVVQPHRLSEVRDRLSDTGQVFLEPGDRLEVDVEGIQDHEVRRAFNVDYPEAPGETPIAVVAWHARDADITLYGRGIGAAHDLAQPLRETVYGIMIETGKNPIIMTVRPEVNVDASSIRAIQIGAVKVFFEAGEDTKKERPKGYADEQQAKGDYRFSKDADFRRGTEITLQPGTEIGGMDPQKLEELLRSLKAAGIVVRPAA